MGTKNRKKLGKKCPDCKKLIYDTSTTCFDCFINSNRNPFRHLDVRGEANPFYGMSHSEETKERLRQKSLGHPGVTGPDHPAWKGGRVKVICEYCSKEFERFPGKVKQSRRYNHRIYCSRSCYIAAWRSEYPRGGNNDYIWLYEPQHLMANKAGYVAEHRKVMAEIIGRPLLSNEVVHHKNRNRADNRPENLGLFSSNAKHLRTQHSPRRHRRQ